VSDETAGPGDRPDEQPGPTDSSVSDQDISVSDQDISVSDQDISVSDRDIPASDRDTEDGPAPPTDIIILTGMSGAGRSTTGNALEDLGWYVVDNLPPQMLAPMADLAERSRGGVSRLAAAVDVRSRSFFVDLREALTALRARGLAPRVVFLDAADDVLVRRFESVRRPHPLQGEGRILDGIAAERALLSGLKSDADIVIDTSGLNVHQLSAKVAQAFGEERGQEPRLRATVMSFGFEYGIPLDADIVLDMRFLPNPHWVPELRPQTGLDADVSSYVLSLPEAKQFLDRLVPALEPVLSGYQREGKTYVTIAIGCTGGKHRSVATAEELARRLTGLGVASRTVHRDLGLE
jgi:RNase adapter protein RapZ